MKWHSFHRLVALLLSTNYFAFQVELFEEEYEASHPRSYETSSISKPGVTWESFDKENAPKAFVFDVDVRIQFLFLLQSGSVNFLLPHTPFQPIRDKSPPAG
jgi:hypothetical protein